MTQKKIGGFVVWFFFFNFRLSAYDTNYRTELTYMEHASIVF